MLGFDPGSAVSYDPILTLVSLAPRSARRAPPSRSPRPSAPTGAMSSGPPSSWGTGICHALCRDGGAPDRRGARLRSAAPSSSRSPSPSRPRWPRSSSPAASSGLVARGRRRHPRARHRRHALHGDGRAPPDAGSGGRHRHAGPPPYPLAFGVAGTTVLILFLALMASLHDQRVNILAALDAGGVGYWELDLANWRLHLSPRGKAILGSAADGRRSMPTSSTRFRRAAEARSSRDLHEAIDTARLRRGIPAGAATDG